MEEAEVEYDDYGDDYITEYDYGVDEELVPPQWKRVSSRTRSK